MSGIVGEFLNVAEVLRRRGFAISLDPGYDLHVYAGNFGRQFGGEAERFPEWVRLLRVLGDPLPEGYTEDIVERIRIEVANGRWKRPPGRSGTWSWLHNRLKSRIVETLRRLEARLLIVENGSLPENPLVTEAIYDAIEEYGSVARLKRYVFWRDFDLMWSVERDRYSPFPYPGTPQIRKSRHIQYVVVSEWMRERVAKWVPGVPVAVLPDRFAITHPDLCPRDRFRRAFGIPQDAFLIARCTRVIPQKCIERDLRWIQALREALRALSDERDIFLFITGPVNEDPVETARLRALTYDLGLGRNVVWGDGLQPFNPLVRRGYPDGFSIADLLHASDVSSFLTSFGFEGFGNPPGEAMAMGVPYVSTSYELYEEIYGNRGAVAPILPISRSSSCSDPLPRSFIIQTLRCLVDPAHRRAVIEQNSDVCRRHFSLDLLEQDIERLLQLDRVPPLAS